MAPEVDVTKQDKKREKLEKKFAKKLGEEPFAEGELQDLATAISSVAVEMGRNEQALGDALKNLQQGPSRALERLLRTALHHLGGEELISREEAAALVRAAEDARKRDLIKGIHIGENAPEVVTVVIEMRAEDQMKYEVDKEFGVLKANRPLEYSSRPPVGYGYIPQTFSGPRVAKFFSEEMGLGPFAADEDPIDICVVTANSQFDERSFLVDARPIGVLRVLDGKEVDEKVIAVMEADSELKEIETIKDMKKRYPSKLEAIVHYFESYKDRRTSSKPKVEIVDPKGPGKHKDAQEIIRLAHEDFKEEHAKELRDGQLLRSLRERLEGSS